MSELPEITGVQRFRYYPGDRFIVRIGASLFSPEEAGEIARRFRAVLQLPAGTPVAVIGEDTGVEIVSPG